jgi:hypothetical protein
VSGDSNVASICNGYPILTRSPYWGIAQEQYKDPQSTYPASADLSVFSLDEFCYKTTATYQGIEKDDLVSDAAISPKTTFCQRQ